MRLPSLRSAFRNVEDIVDASPKGRSQSAVCLKDVFPSDFNAFAPEIPHVYISLQLVPIVAANMGKLIVEARFAVLAAAQDAADAGVMGAVDIGQIPRLARVREAEDTGTAGIHVAEIILLSLNGIAAGLSGDLIVIGLISQRPDENGGTVSVPL